MATDGQIRFILMTDIARSSHLWEYFPSEYPTLLERHNQLVEDCVAKFNGEVMKNLGDGYIALFDSPLAPVNAAVLLQRTLAGQEGQPLLGFSDGTHLMLRAVVHGGSLQQLAAGRGWFGTPLNRAARICGVCHPGQTLISASTQQWLAELPAKCTIEDLGRCRLRDLGEPEQIYQLDHPDFGQHRFPPLIGLNYRPNNLTQQPGSFVGREPELRALRKLLLDRERRLVTIIAPGGYGKSRLANQLAASVLHRYNDGVWVAELAPLPDATRLADTLAAAVGLQLAEGPASPREQLLSFLHDKQLLLHCDNFERITDGVPLVAAILQQAPGVQILMTSRAALLLREEQLFELEPLPVNPPASGLELAAALELYIDRAHRVNPAFELTAENAADATELTAWLQGIPLAIELAAAWAKQWTPRETLEQLTRQLDLTSRLVDLPARQQSMQACCDWSWSLLDPNEQTALMQLAVFSGGFFAEAAQAVLQQDPAVRAVQLAGLSEKTWLLTREAAGQTRFALRDAVLQNYAAAKLAEPDNTALLRSSRLAHAKYFARVAEAAGPELRQRGQQDALQVFNLEAENFNLAFAYCLGAARSERDGDDLPLELGALLQPLVRFMAQYLYATARFSQIEQMHAELAAVLAACGLQGTRGRRLLLQLAFTRAQAMGQTQSPDATLRTLAEISAEAAQLGEPALHFQSLGQQVLHFGRLERWAEAEATLAAMAQLAEEVPDGDIALANSTGLLSAMAGDQTRAETALRQVAARYRERGDQIGLTSALTNLGVLKVNAGQLAAARVYYIEAAKLGRQAEAGHRAAVPLINLADMALEEEDLPAARRHMDEALALVRKLGLAGAHYSGIFFLAAHIARRNGNLNEARQLCQQGLAGHPARRDRRALLNELSAIELEASALGGAARALLESLELAGPQDDPSRRSGCLAAGAALLARAEEYGAGVRCAAAGQTLAAHAAGSFCYFTRERLGHSAALMAAALERHAYTAAQLAAWEQAAAGALDPAQLEIELLEKTRQLLERLDPAAENSRA